MFEASLHHWIPTVSYRNQSILIGRPFRDQPHFLEGGAAGLGVAHFVDGLSARIAGSTLTLVIDHVAMISGGAVALAIGLIGALIPAWRAARIPLTAALH